MDRISEIKARLECDPEYIWGVGENILEDISYLLGEVQRLQDAHNRLSKAFMKEQDGIATLQNTLREAHNVFNALHNLNHHTIEEELWRITPIREKIREVLP